MKKRLKELTKHNLKFRFLVLLSLCGSQLNAQPFKQGLKDFGYWSGIYGQFNLVNFDSYEIGANLTATHGLLKTDNFRFYSINVGYVKLRNTDFERNGFQFGLSTQLYNHGFWGLELAASSTHFKNIAILRPTIGIGFAGIFFLNYGYNFGLREVIHPNFSNHHLGLKIVLNISSGEFLNIVGRSNYTW